ncbi:hypothetical protein M405DRAFT_227107 [Rhizopogon salebrosus TDB-379]|nr:hypothetical protein M405DRAFT_227107 [Rhizopogon salebrosus TDB-379]
MFSAECIFIVRAYAVWERRFTVFTIISIIAYMTLIIVCLQGFISSASATGECSITEVTGYLDTMARSKLIAVYSLLIIAELEILLVLLYPAVKSYGWRIDNRLMRGLIQHNLIYFACGFAFSLIIILAIVFLPFVAVHMLAQFQVIVQGIVVTRMHRDFWKSDRVSCNIYSQGIPLTTFMAIVPDLV